jgi:hypothetical protein
VLPEKCSICSFLPRTPSEFQQANLRAFATFILLDRAAIFGYKEENGFEDGTRTGHP